VPCAPLIAIYQAGGGQRPPSPFRFGLLLPRWTFQIEAVGASGIRSRRWAVARRWTAPITTVSMITVWDVMFALRLSPRLLGDENAECLSPVHCGTPVGMAMPW